MTDKPDTMPPPIILSGVPEALHALCDAVANETGTEDLFHAALAAVHNYARQHAAAECAALVEALEHVTANYRRTLAGKPVRDVCETLSEADAALAAHKEKQ